MKTKNRFGAVLLVLILGFVPLVVSACHFRIGLKECPWFSNADTSYDFFLYWKGQALILLCACMALYVAVLQFFGKKEYQVDTWSERMRVSGLERKYILPLVIYFVLSVLSTVFSEHRDMAVWGGYEQWEGMFIIAAYVITLVFASMFAVGKTEIRIIEWGVLAGVLILSVLGAMQFFGYDFFRTDAGQAVMNFMIEKKLRFSFNFELGRVYATLHNPNYVGSYVALMLPVVLSQLSFKKQAAAVLRSVIALACGILLCVMLFGSESVTGCIGVLATLLVFAIYFIVNNKRHLRRIVLCGSICAAAMTVAVWANRPIFEYGWNKFANPAPNQFFVKAMESKDGNLVIHTVADDVLKLSVEVRAGQYEYEAQDQGGQPVSMYRDEGTDKMRFHDERFSQIEISEKQMETDGEERDAFVIETPSEGKSYTVFSSREESVMGLSQVIYRIYTPFDKTDRLRPIASMGFEKNQHFGSRRGFIWSRTFPLLKRHLLLGSGPNTFVYEFPNDDYVGLVNVGYAGAVVTKPHNMFLQIWVQTGLLSLLAFLLLYVWYFVDSVRLYFSRTAVSRGDKVGIGILLGTFGYMVTGLANDSSVAVAPLFWCLLGIGMAVNRQNKNREREAEGGEGACQ